MAAVVLLLCACGAGGARASGDTSDNRVPGAGSDLHPRILGPVTPIGHVGPAEDHPLAHIDRDAGISAVLGDGSVVWFFGDTAMRNPDGTLSFFEIGSAAWAGARQPTVTLDHVSGDRVEPFADPTDEFPPCPKEAPEAGMWPLSAVADPTDESRVILWMANVCLGSNRTLVSHGVSVGEWVYDPADPPAGQPVKVEVLEQNLFPDASYGAAAVVVGDRIVVYGCTPPRAEGRVITDPGSCRAARVQPSQVADAGAYEAWVGDQWSSAAAPAPMEMPESEDRALGAAPPGSLSVSAAPGSEGFVMLYTPWPGFAPWVAVRVAAEPIGPWSEPVRIELPDCDVGPSASTACYAANVQPHFFSDGNLAFGYYDRSTSEGELGGGYLLASVGFEVSQDR